MQVEASAGAPTRSAKVLRFLSGEWLTGRRAFWLVFATAAASVLLMMAVQFTQSFFTPRGQGDQIDFAAFWSTSVLTLQGTPALAYDLESSMPIQEEALRLTQLPEMPWIYPPTFQLLVMPLGFVPIMPAKIIWCVITGALYLAVAWRIAPGRATLYAAIAPSPVVFNFVSGQAGFLTAAITGLGLIFWHRRPVVAGIAFGLMCIKPQLVIVGLLGAIASRRWSLIAAAVFTGIAFFSLSLVVLGIDTWLAFPKGIARATRDYQSLEVFHFYASTSGALRDIGVGFGPSLTAQAVVSIAAGIALIRGICNPAVAPDAKSALLAYAMIAASPRVMDYDLLILVLGALFQVRHAQARGYFAGERLILLLAVLISWLDLGLPLTRLTAFNALDALIAPMLLGALVLGERHRPGNLPQAGTSAAMLALPTGFGAQAGRLLRFGVVGVAATATHVAVLTGLVELAGTDPRLANFVGFAMAVPVSYLGHYYWSFGSQHPHGETMLRFVIVAVSSLLGSQALMLLALDILGAGYGVGVVLMVVVMPLVNFAVQQAMVFRRRPRVARDGNGCA